MPQHPATIGRYQITEELGRGGLGIVYKAYDPQLNRYVALKYLPLSNKTQHNRWRREAQTIANLSHAHIVPIYDAVQTDHAAYLVMELLTGGTLRRHLNEPLPWRTGISLLLPIIDALAYAHQQGVVHRDVKPENILFSGSGQLKLVDFGLAYLVGATRLTQEDAVVMGTLCYAAPEQIQGEAVDGRADIFALATVLYEAITGFPLFSDALPHIINQKIASEQAVDLSALQGIAPGPLIESLARGLAKNPADRYPVVDEFGDTLRHCLGSGPISPNVTRLSPNSPPPPTNQTTQQSLSTLITWPANLWHTPEEDALLRQLYQTGSTSRDAPSAIAEIIIKEEMPGGFGGARVLVVIPVKQNGTHQAARVVKLGPRVMLEAESNNYNDFVHQHLTVGLANLMSFTTLGMKAAIEYVYVAGSWLEPVTDLITYYKKHSAAEVVQTLEALLVDHLGQSWYRQGHLLEEHANVEYGSHLPAQLSLALRLGSDDQLIDADETITLSGESYRLLKLDDLSGNQISVMPAALVQIQELKVVRIKPWAATLTHCRERHLRIRVEYEETSGIAEKLRIGQEMTVRGQVIITRHELLKTVVQAAFEAAETVDVAVGDDQVFAGIGQQGPYPNPLKLYPAYLDKMLAGHRSIIHGDLHLRNVLVDQGGRPWLIDFGRVREGHTLFDFIKLETYLRLDVLSKSAGFTLTEYAWFEEALANAMFYGLSCAKIPANTELRKSFRVIRHVRRLIDQIDGQFLEPQTYAHCLLLYNLAVLKYARQAVLEQGTTVEKRAAQLQAARLNFTVAAVQGRWLEDPPSPRLQLSGLLEALREALARRLSSIAKPVLVGFGLLTLILVLGLGYGLYQAERHNQQAQAEILNSQGAVFLEQGNPEMAVDHLRQAVQVDPQNPTVRLNLGLAYFTLHDFDEATDQLKVAQALDPSYAAPHYTLGRVYSAQNQVDEALSETRQAIELDPGMSEAYSELGYLLNGQGQYAEAVTVLREGLERGRQPNPPYLLKNLGQAYLGLGQPQEAIQSLEVAAARLAPGDALYIETYRLLAEAYEKNSNFDQALAVWQDALRNEADASEHIRQLQLHQQE